MFNKRYLAIAGIVALAIAAAGCGKKNNTTEQTPVQVTPTETPQATPTVTVELVNMEEAAEKNVIGEKTATASKVTIVNNTGSEIASIYIRETPSDTSDDEEDDSDLWGDDLVNGMFTLKSGENAVYYYEKPSSNTTYDIRIAYTDEDANECFFRKLPLTTMKQITLRMDGQGEDSIPYATYFTTSGNKEIATLNEVKKRLGLDTDSSNDGVTPTPDPSDSADPTQAPDNTADPTQAPDSDDSNNNNDNNNSDNNNNNSDSDGDNTNPTDSTIQAAEGYIGKSLDDLVSNIGDSSSSEYEEDPDNGTSGYYYYNNFTVSTTVDADGNEIVTGVW